MRIALALLLLAASALAQQTFEIREGDRVLLLGDVLLEREGTYGAIETRMAQQFPNTRFSVRNLSWSGETPTGVARASFDPPAKGWERLQQQIAEVKPTVAILGFGMAASLQEITDRSGDLMLNRDVARYGAEPMTAERFGKELEQLATEIAKSGEVRFVFVSPISHQDLRADRAGLPDPAPHNQLLAAYAKQIEQVAQAHHGRYISLLELKPRTSNGIHLVADGYQAVAAHVAASLGWNNSVTANLPLRDAIIRKNLLFFHRFRPANETYLFGFRKHEQGQNAKEIPLFDPLIARAEEQVEALKKGTPAPARGAAEAAEPKSKPTPPPLPDFDVQPGFEIALWATNPLLEKPVQMNWDSDGRLWVASSSTYPQVNPEDVAATLAGQIANAKDAPSAGNDRVIILEDTDHDGKADKSTVFAEGLLIPTAVAPFRMANGRWGCYVGQSTQILKLMDTDGDGRADQSEIVQSGFGTEDTHHLVHTMKWRGGTLYFNQSIYIHTHMETPWGMVRLNSGGVMSWDPRTEKVEVHFKGFCNPWGHVWDGNGESFITDGAGFQGVTWGIPGAMYFTYEHGQKLCPSISPGSYPKFCSLEIMKSPHFPEDWQGSLITCDFRAHRIVHFGLNDLSKAKENPTSGFITTELPDLVRTGDLSFRPIDVRLGPDGALYVADWSNPVINHGEVDFRDPRRDHHMGRVWKITRKDAPLVKWEKIELNFQNVTQPGKLDRLLTKNAWEERAGMEELSRALPQSAAMHLEPVKNAEVALHQQLEILARRAQQHELLPSTIGHLGQELANAARLNAPASLQKEITAARQALNAAAAHENPRVRLAAMRALAGLGTADAADAVLKAAEHAPANDPYYDYAAWLSINDLAEPWTKAVLSGAWKIDSPEREKQLEVALNALDPRVGGSVLAKTLEGREIAGEGKGPWIELIGRAGGVNELRRLFDALTAQKLNPEASSRALAALADATRLRNVRPSGDLAAIETLLSHENPQISAAAAQLIGAWKTPHALTLLREAAGQGTRNLPVQVQVAAVRGLQDIGGPQVIGILQNLTANQPSPAVPRAAAVALAAIDVRGSLPQIVAVLNSLPQEQERLDTWRAVLAAKGAPGQLANALTKGTPAISLAQPAAQTGLRVARELGRNGQQLVAALTPIAGVAATNAPAPTDYSSIVNNVKTNGDPAKGEEVYRRLQLACTTCHAIGGAGGKVGPELTSLGASAPLDYIIESVLVPQAKVKEGFHAVSLTLKDGSAAVGIQSRETAQEVFLRDASGKESSVPKTNITGKETIGSIMPAGLIDQLKPREQIDLYAFLSQLGKPGPYDASKGTVARYWALTATSSSSSSLSSLNAWPPANAAPAYTLVDGRLTKEQLETALQFLANPGSAVTAQARFQAPVGGPTTLRLTGAAAATLDGQPLAIQPDGTANPNLATGEHTVSVQLDPKNPPTVLRLEGPQVRFLGN